MKALARDDGGAATALKGNGLIHPYAAVRMVEGEGFARGGTFSNHFDAVNTYGIYAEGGTLTASGANFTTGGNGVCIRVQSAKAEDKTTGGSLTISGGEFSSEIGNTIEMSGGNMTVTNGTFTKNASAAITASTDNGSAIDIQGGTLNSSESESTEERKPIQFEISGSYVNGIHAAGGEVNIANASFEFLDGNNNRGIFNNGGTSRAHWCDFMIHGNNNYGISSTNGITRATGCTITMTGEYVVGVYTTGGRALIEGGSIKIGFADGKTDKSLTSTAVSTEGGEIYLAGILTIESASLGVTVRKGEDTQGLLEIATDTITTTDGTIYSDIDSGNVIINTPNATGIYVNNGNLTNKGTVAVTSFVGDEEGADNGWNWVGVDGNLLNSFNKYNGVYVQGGSLISTGTLNVTFTGVQNDQDQTVNGEALTGKNAYRLFEIKSYAVRVEGDANTTVTIASGNITNSVGGGVLVNGGTVHLGGYVDENGTAHTSQNPVTVQTTGKGVYYTLIGQYIDSGIYDAMNGANDADDGDIQSGGNWRYLLPKTGGPAVKVTNGNLSVYGGSYQALQGDGIVINGGKAEIQSGKFLGQDSYYIKNNYRTEGWWPWEETVFAGASVVTSNIEEPQAGPAASYAFKVYNGTANVYGGTFGSSTSIASGAFVMGTSTSSKGTANIYGGSFVVSSGNTGGQAGFSVYEYGNVVVNPGKGGEQQNLGGDVTMTGLAAGLVIEGNTSNPASVQISGGTFSSTRDNGNSDGIWYSNSNATLRISGGTFAGAARSGLYFAVDPSNNVRITGGTFVANQGNPISGYFNQVVPSEYEIISGSNNRGDSCTIG